ncbi:class I SAM-dependent methyltransferase [Mycolicibacterium vinylchloridicum]|uniref:class I SAM-dependent methyltransferase n=1 Tax=Mycolicibacterium vinylchloridicum TaxID=2736928 RepID=UPI0015CE1EDC|nr:class I SAM-dependent methyltransferase [Mycolicibacterium vinylchloridicum]
MTVIRNPFDDAGHVAMYAERAAQMVPAYRDIHRLATVLIAEHAPPDARILVLGAGGGMETRAFAEAQPGWAFDAVDPSAAMLELAAQHLGPHAARVRMHCGYIDDAPPGPFAAATSLLTLHFLPYDQRRHTAAQVRQRLAPGAPFVVAHLSFPQHDDAERQLWMERHAANLVAAGIDASDVEKARTAISTQVPVLSPEQDRAVLREAGFTDITEFFSAFTFRGWVGYA